jgi:hypothetical protein
MSMFVLIVVEMNDLILDGGIFLISKDEKMRDIILIDSDLFFFLFFGMEE